MMREPEKSDPAEVAKKPANASGRPLGELVERRAGAERNANEDGSDRTPSRASLSPGFERVRQAAREKKKLKFTVLLHHVDVDLLRESFFALKRDAVPGVDGVTWDDYAAGLDERIVDLHGRVHRGACRAQPSRR